MRRVPRSGDLRGYDDTMLMQTEPYAEEEENKASGAAIRAALAFLSRRWKMIAAYAAATMILAVIIMLTMTPYYTARTQILLNQADSKSSGADAVLTQISGSNAVVDSQLSLITSTALLRRVVQKENLLSNPEFVGTGQRSLLSSAIGVLTSVFATAPLMEEPPPSAEDANALTPAELRAIGQLRGAIRASRVRLTYVIEISATAKSPKMAAKLANAVANAYVIDQLEARYETAQRASVWLSERLTTLADQLRDSEEAVAAFRKQHNLIALPNGTINEQQLSELNVKLATARAETAVAAARYDQVVSAREKGANPASLPDVMRSPVIAQLRGQEAEVNRKEADLVARYGARHPLVVNVRAEVADIQGAITAETRRILDTIQRSYEVAKAQQAALEQNIAQLTGQTGADEAVSIRLRELQRVANANRTLYENFLSRAKLTSEYVTFEAPESRIITVAVPPGAPSYPRKTLGLALAMVIGLVIGLAAAYLVELLNTGFTSPSQVMETLGIPILARIPLTLEDGPASADPETGSAGKKGHRGQTIQRRADSQAIAHLVVEKPLVHYSEAIRTLRTSLHMSDVDHPPKLIMVTSTMPGEGKSTTMASFALSCAVSGARTLLVDCDLRKKSLTHQFQLQNNPGLVDVLTGARPLRECIFQDTETGLHIFPGGADTQTPQDLLTSTRLQKLMQELGADYDYVLVDAPPLGPLADAVILSNLVDKLFFVVRWNETPRQLAREALQTIRDHRKVAGAVLTMIDERAAAKYSAYSIYAGGYYSQYTENYHRR